MLISCPECELQVSDKALSCPHCGFPLNSDSRARKPRNKNNKRRRLPNGFGQISEIKKRNLRKPFRAMVTVGKRESGRPICKPLKPEAYFSTYNEAYEALVNYNKNPYDLEPAITVAELYAKWSEDHFKTLSSNNGISGIRYAWSYCSSVYNMRVKDIRARHIKGCMEDGYSMVRGEKRTTTATLKNKIKSLFNQMLDYALEYELVDRNYARSFNLTKETISQTHDVQKEHLPFTDEEMRTLWEHIDDKKYVDALIVQCYSGWRPQEIGLIKIENVDLSGGFFKGGMKTEAGENRMVPIHSRIRPIVERKYEEAVSVGSDFLFNCFDSKRKNQYKSFTYGRYYQGFCQLRDELKLNPAHRPHDGRKHFVTAAKKYGVDEYAIKYMVGHKIQDITEKVYTKRELTWLQDEIEKIK